MNIVTHTVHRSFCWSVHDCQEYEIVASIASADNSGSGSGVAVKHGAVGKGPVVGLIQVSLCTPPISYGTRSVTIPCERESLELDL